MCTIRIVVKGFTSTNSYNHNPHLTQMLKFAKTTAQYEILIEANRKFRWTEFDPSQDARTILAVQNIKNWSTNSNKLLSAIRNYIEDAPNLELYADDPLYYLDEWKKLNEINLPKKELPFNQQAIKVWFEENENEIEENCKQLVQDIRHIWSNSYYQERSSLINESTFTHDILSLSSIINFISFRFFKRWDQAKSISAKEHRVRIW
ncbi:hypothetical protein C2G38_2178602 [Gigaspora rosea]|uniref:Uncharacterized protein n=1 Tax=Gigaspora rosea TaxID=44941 RepID=A0A397VFE4_9GLOM|nr:hypothetical protein C2G38_2178602 [Gigaspora rosea]